MKKFVSTIFLMAVLCLGAGLRAEEGSVKKDGSDLLNRSRLGLGNYAGAVSYLAVPMTAEAPITVGMAVKASADKASGYYSTVSGTATAGDQNVIGIATNTAAAGATCWVAIAGTVPARFPASTTVTVGVFYSGTTAGALTPTSTLTETSFTQLSRTPTICWSLESKVVAADGLAKVLIVR